jgi:hypothetical protein
MMKRILLVCAAIGLTACAEKRELPDMSIASGRLLDAVRKVTEPVGAPGARARGEDCMKSIFFIPYTSLSDMGRALEAAIASVPGAEALVDVKVHKDKLTAVAFNRYCYIVEGTPVRFTRK